MVSSPSPPSKKANVARWLNLAGAIRGVAAVGAGFLGALGSAFFLNALNDITSVAAAASRLSFQGYDKNEQRRIRIASAVQIASLTSMYGVMLGVGPLTSRIPEGRVAFKTRATFKGIETALNFTGNIASPFELQGKVSKKDLAINMAFVGVASASSFFSHGRQEIKSFHSMNQEYERRYRGVPPEDVEPLLAQGGVGVQPQHPVGVGVQPQDPAHLHQQQPPPPGGVGVHAQPPQQPQQPQQPPPVVGPLHNTIPHPLPPGQYLILPHHTSDPWLLPPGHTATLMAWQPPHLPEHIRNYLIMNNGWNPPPEWNDP